MEYGGLKRLLIFVLGFLSPITAAGARWAFVPDWLLLLALMVYAGAGALLAYLLQPPTTAQDIQDLVSNSSRRPHLGEDEVLIPPLDYPRENPPLGPSISSK